MINCKACGEEIEISAALQGQIEAQVLAAAHKKHEAELARVISEAADRAKHEREADRDITRKLLAGEKENLRRQTETELELTKQRLQAEALNAQKKAAAQQEMLIQSLRDDSKHKEETVKQLQESNVQMREQLTELMKTLRAEKQARENAELEASKKLAAEEGKIREEAMKVADERQRLNIAAKEKQLQDALKVNEELQRKLQQGSQQMQGEVMELDLEQALANAFRDDCLTPVAKGVNGADISQTVCNSRGTACGIILWEIKRTKNWTDSWIPKLKADLRNAKANIPVIVTEAMPKQLEDEIGQLEGVWICKPKHTVVLGALLRQGLLDVAVQKALAQNKGGKAEALFSFVTSHEFVQQVESMLETYQEMSLQIQKERVAYEKLWSQREKQAQKLFMGTANIIGGMQGHIGQSSMPRIKGLELDAGDMNEDPLTTIYAEPELASVAAASPARAAKEKRDEQDGRPIQLSAL
ncbi:MAG TPA: DUF2130 domain-containing protein [Candidatus Limnocylindrales bacterium]|nr:DUF2130 domain-containing protein [Candidatus Limnocylindrales bacterium]